MVLDDALKQVQVRFVTRHTQYAVTDTPTLVPVNLKRYGLSEVVNHLLGTADTPTPFAFFVDNNALLGSLADFLREHGLTTEHVVELHYAPTARPPREQASIPHDDWIAAVDITETGFLSGSYDGVVRVFNKSAQLERQLVGHEGPVTSVVSGLDVGDQTVFSGSHDQTIIGWGATGKVLNRYVGHESSVTSIAVGRVDQVASGAFLYSGSWDGELKIWRLMSQDGDGSDASDDNDTHTTTLAAKRRKGTAAVKSAAASFSGHTGPVTAVALHQQRPGLLYSASWDHTLKVWDVASTVSREQQNFGKAITAMDLNASTGLIAVGHSDSLVRVWDPRAPEGSTTKLSVHTKQGWISSISWSDRNHHLLACASYDGSIKVMDMRTQAPLYSIKDSIDRKILACGWRHGWLVSGGEDSILHVKACE